MQFDELGLPQRPDFEDAPKRYRAQVTFGRLMLVMAVVMFAGLLGLIAQFGGDLFGKMGGALEGVFADRFVNLKQRFNENVQKGDLEAAHADISELIQMAPTSDAAYLIRGNLRQQMGRQEDAIEDFTRAIELGGQSTVDAYVQRGLSLGALDRYDEAVADYTRALEFTPDLAEALNNRAFTLALSRQNIDQAEADIQRSLEISGAVPSSIDTRGYLHYLRGRHKQALADFNRVLEDPDMQMPDVAMGEVHFHRGLVYRQLGEPEMAQRDFDAAGRLGFTIKDYPAPLEAKQTK